MKSGKRPEKRAERESRFWTMTVSFSMGISKDEPLRLLSALMKSLSSSELQTLDRSVFDEIAETKFKRISALRCCNSLMRGLEGLWIVGPKCEGDSMVLLVLLPFEADAYETWIIKGNVMNLDMIRINR